MIYMMDVSGSMTDEQKADRPHRGLLARHLAAEANTTASKPATSSTTPRPRRSTKKRSTTPAKAAARGSARPTKFAPNLIASNFPPSEWNIYCFQFSDGDNWGEDNEQSLRLLREELLPAVNLFCYGQVESPYGSGEYIRALRAAFGDDARKPGRSPKSKTKKAFTTRSSCF